MKRYVLDTDTAIYWLNGEGKIQNKVKQIGPSNLRITRMSPRQTDICVYLRSSAVPRMQIPENIWPGTYLSGVPDIMAETAEMIHNAGDVLGNCFREEGET